MRRKAEKIQNLDSENAASSTPKKNKRASATGDAIGSPTKKKATAYRTLPFGDWNPEHTFLGDMKVLSAMWFGKITGDSHQDRLESFYR